VAVTSAKTNVERFGQQLTQLGDLTAGLEKFPQEAVTIIAALSSLRTNLGEANRAWAEVAEVTDGASKSIARAGVALSTLEHGTQAAEQSVLNWSGGLTKASVGLEALSEIAERAVRLGNDAVTTQVRLSAQLSGPLADQLRNQGEAASALVKRLQEDLRASEEAVRKVHHHLIDASRFILSKVEYRR
jgi:methyl-accepting chemotaxis protein